MLPAYLNQTTLAVGATVPVPGTGIAIVPNSNGGLTVSATQATVAAFIPGVLADNQVLLYLAVYPSMKFPAGAANSIAVAQTPVAGSPPAPAVTFHLRKNGGSDFATVTFNPGSLTGTWTQVSDVTFNGTSDVLSIIAPATHDLTLANVGITLAGVRI